MVWNSYQPSQLQILLLELDNILLWSCGSAHMLQSKETFHVSDDHSSLRLCFVVVEFASGLFWEFPKLLHSIVRNSIVEVERKDFLKIFACSRFRKSNCGRMTFNKLNGRSRRDSFPFSSRKHFMAAICWSGSATSLDAQAGRSCEPLEVPLAA